MANIRTRTVTFLATATALLLVFLFGSTVYLDWVQKHANGTSAGDQFLQALAYPHWAFSTHQSIRDLVAGDLLAIFVVALTWVFVMWIGRGPYTGVRGTIGHFLHGWATYVFAGAFAALVASFFGSSSSLSSAFFSAERGAAYGLLVGWIVGLVTLASEGSGD